MNKKINILKKTVTTVVGIGTTKIIHSIITNNVERNNVIDKVTVTTASLAIGGAVSELTEKYTDDLIDRTAAAIQRIKNRQNESQ